MEQIMNQTDVKVSFYLKKSEADAKGNCPVMARLIVGSTLKQHSVLSFVCHSLCGYLDVPVGKALRPET